jgi:hypothetical protein
VQRVLGAYVRRPKLQRRIVPLCEMFVVSVFVGGLHPIGWHGSSTMRASTPLPSELSSEEKRAKRVLDAFDAETGGGSDVPVS